MSTASRWSGSVAVITGGASGLGAASATALAAQGMQVALFDMNEDCLLYTSPSPRDATLSRMPSSA